MIEDYVDLAPVPLFLLAAVAICVAPGPDMIYMVGTGLAGGRPAAVRAAFGIALGVTVYVVATAAGLGVMVSAHPRVLTVVQLIGALYLGWLAISTLRAPHDAASVLQPGDRHWFRRGFVVNVTNPKIVLFFVAFLPQFVGTSGSPGAQLLMLGFLLLGIGLVVDLMIGVSAGSIRARVLDRPAVLRGTTVASAVVFAGLAVFVAADTVAALT